MDTVTIALKALFVIAGGLALLFGCGIIWAAFYDATNPANTLDWGRIAVGGVIVAVGLLTIILPLTR